MPGSREHFDLIDPQSEPTITLRINNYNELGLLIDNSLFIYPIFTYCDRSAVVSVNLIVPRLPAHPSAACTIPGWLHNSRLAAHPSASYTPLGFLHTPRLPTHPSASYTPLGFLHTPRLPTHPSASYTPLGFLHTPRLPTHPSASYTPLCFLYTLHTLTQHVLGTL